MKAHLQRRKWLIVVMFSVLLCLVLAPSSYALEVFDDSTVTIEAGTVIEDDLVVFANEFVLDGTVKGDLIFFATTTTINGVVEGDLMGGGQEVMINGRVTDDARVGGMVITLGEAAQIGDDFMVGGYSLESLAGSQVQGDVYFGGAQSRLAGDIGGDLWVSAGGLELLGTVAGDVQADVGAATDAPPFSPFMFMPGTVNVPAFEWGLTVGEQAQIGGDLNYSAPVAATVPAGVVAGDVAFEQVIQTTATEPVETVTTTQKAVNWLADWLRQLVTLLFVGFLMMWLLPRWTGKVAGFVQERPLPSLGWGLMAVATILVTIVLVFIVMIMLAMALGALTLADLVGAVIVIGLFVLFGLMLLFGFTVSYFSRIIVAVAGGRYLFSRFHSRFAESGYWSMALGVLLIAILTAIPWVGPLISLVVVLLGFGALWQEGIQGWQRRLGSWRAEEPMPEMKVKPA